MESSREREAFGSNIWLVDEMYRRYLENPHAVSESWREFFEGYRPHGARRRTRGRPEAGGDGRGGAERERTITSGDGAEADDRAAAEGGAPAAAPFAEHRARRSGAADVPEGAVPLRGVSARIAENMIASLDVPTATSVRTLPGKLLEENRRIINRYLAGSRGGKVSFTHLIGWAVLKALEKRPSMNS